MYKCIHSSQAPQNNQPMSTSKSTGDINYIAQDELDELGCMASYLTIIRCIGDMCFHSSAGG
jgi:hypothetical protein